MSALSAIEQARRYLMAIPGAVEHQNGSTATLNAARALVQDFALDDAEALGLLRQWNTTCKPPWKESDLEHKVRDARKKLDPSKVGCKLNGQTPRRNQDADAVEQWAGLRGFRSESVREMGGESTRGCVAVPMFVGDKQVGINLRRPDGSTFRHGGKSHTVKGGSLGVFLSRAVRSGIPADATVYMAEGLPNAIALVDAYAQFVIGLPQAPGTDAALEDIQHRLAGHRGRVIFFADSGPAGTELAGRLTGAAANVGIELRVVPGLPTADLDKRLARAGDRGAELARLIKAAIPWKPATVEGDNATDDIRSELWRIAQQPKLTATERQRAIADAVVKWLRARGQFYFHPERRDFASVLYFDSRDKTLLPIQSDAIRARLSDALAMNRSERMFAFVQSAIETEGLSSRSTAIAPAAYWARTAEAIYISNGPGRVIRIRADRVELVDNGTDGVLFPYGWTLESWTLTDPVDPFEACALFRDLSATASHGRDLFRLFGASLPTDQPNKPPLVVSGPIGSGKTAVARGLFELYGLPTRVMGVLKNGESDLWAALDGGGLVALDNADTSIDWLPDALAGAATGGSQIKRRLYTDADQVVLKARSWVIITSASPTFAADAGLADRLLVVRQDRRRGETAESQLFDEIRANRDAGLSWIAWTLASALADTSPVPKNLNARHPDFAAMAVRIGRATGREQETIAALRAAEADKHFFNLENDAVGAAVLDLVRSDSFEGTAADLLDALKAADSSTFEKMTTKRLAKKLGRLWPHIEAALSATSERGHGGLIRYSFSAPCGWIGWIERPFSGKPLTRENNRTLYENTPANQPNQPDDPEPNLFGDPSAEVVEHDPLPF